MMKILIRCSLAIVRIGFLATVLVHGTEVCHAQEAHGFKIGEATSISPFLEGTVTYDNNVPLNPAGSEVDDLYINLTLGLSLLKQTESDNLSIQGWVQRREYSSFRELSDWTWQERAEYVFGNPDRLQLRLKQRYGSLSDYEFTQSDVGAASERREATQRLIETRTRRTERDLQDYQLEVERETRHLQLQLGGSYSAVDFGRSDFDLSNWSEYQVEPFVGLRVSGKTMVSLGGSIGMQEKEEDMGDMNYLRGLLGIRYTAAEKTRLHIGVGLQEHTVPDDPSLDNFDFHFSGKAIWAATQKITLQAYGRNEYQPTSAFANNTKRVDQGSVGAVYDLTQRIYCSAGLSYRADVYTAPINDVDALETQKGIQAKITFRSKKRRMQIYLGGRYEVFDSNIQDDYNQLRLKLGAQIAI